MVPPWKRSHQHDAKDGPTQVSWCFWISGLGRPVYIIQLPFMTNNQIHGAWIDAKTWPDNYKSACRMWKISQVVPAE
jgi:hypothetical protein